MGIVGPLQVGKGRRVGPGLALAQARGELGEQGRAEIARRSLDSGKTCLPRRSGRLSAPEPLSRGERGGGRQGPGRSPPPTAPRRQARAAAGIRGQRPGRGGRGAGPGRPAARAPHKARPCSAAWDARPAPGPPGVLASCARARARGRAACRGACCGGRAARAPGALPGALRGPGRPGPQAPPAWPPAGRSRAPATYGGSEGALVTVTPGCAWVRC